jgi:hypothetical protein
MEDESPLMGERKEEEDKLKGAERAEMEEEEKEKGKEEEEQGDHFASSKRCGRCREYGHIRKDCCGIFPRKVYNFGCRDRLFTSAWARDQKPT